MNTPAHDHEERRLQPGDTIDVWVVEERLGGGGMGSVYRCRNAHTPRIVAAIKVLHAAPPANARQRFLREAEILFGLDHPNIVKVRNVRLEPPPAFLEMEHVAAGQLDARLRKGPLPLGEALSIAAQLADALDYLHVRGIRHRDVKPANLLVDDRGRLKLVDFGLALALDADRITDVPVRFGTLGYAPPEWIRPDDLDPEKWDLYSAGVVLWEMLVGRPAFPTPRDPTVEDLVRKMAERQTSPALDPGEGFAEPLRQLVRAMTDPDPARRPGAREVQRALAELLVRPGADMPTVPAVSMPTIATPMPADVRAASRVPTDVRSKRRVAFLTAAGAVLVGGLLGVAVAAAALSWWSP